MPTNRNARENTSPICSPPRIRSKIRKSRNAAERLRDCSIPDIREIRVFKRAFRIIYRLDEANRRVEILRFWHSHRDEPEL